MWYDLDISEEGHKIDITCPSRYNMVMDTVIDTGSGNLPPIYPYIESLRMERLPEDSNGCLSEPEEVCTLFLT